MKYLVFILLGLSVSNTFAATKGQFVGMQMIVNIVSKNYDGTVDGSPQVLFESMDRPEQDSVIGRGKTLLAPQRVLNFICAKKGENNYQCSIYIHKSNFSRIGVGKAYFEVKGEEALALFQQFYSKEGVYSFQDESGSFVIYATPERFVIKFGS